MFGLSMPETKGVGRDDGPNIFLHEQFVHRDAILLLKLGMIHRRGQARVQILVQIVLDFERVFDRRRVDDPRALEFAGLRKSSLQRS
jgi:hypothetical protein